MRTISAIVLIMAATLLLWSCSSSNGNAPALDASGKHPANWIIDHRPAFLSSAGAVGAAASQCAECHGTDLKGGVSRVSCFAPGFSTFTCHGHPTNFADPDVHGAAVKAAPGTSTGLSHCQGCHGTGLAGGLLTTVSCLNNTACHGTNNAPHSPAPWRGTRNHNGTNPQNAAACATCHAGGANLVAIPRPTPPPAGTAPGCFNNTLCHGLVGHPAGWNDPAQHGLQAKLTPGPTSGFAYCQVCHGTDFKGGIAQVSCFTASTVSGSCHVRGGAPVNAPHAPAPWRIGVSVRTHTDTDEANGNDPAVCAACHLNGANSPIKPSPPAPAGTSPGCFNGTLCHAVVGHPLGWASPSQHGATGKANLTFCQGCHANPSTGGPGSNPRFNVQLGRLVNGALSGCEVCHKPNTAHPPVLQIPPFINITGTLNRPWFRHKTAGSFTTACVLCHGATFQGGVGPACPNCHRSGLPFQVQNCASCHGTPPSGTAYPNRAFAHTPHNLLPEVKDNCSTCHNGFGTNTLNHFLVAKQQPTLPAPPQQPIPADTAFLASFNARSGTAAFSTAGSTCSNVSCHGGQTTPSWRVGAIDVLTQCETCHALANAVPATSTTPVSPQFNSFFSGQHKFHVGPAGVLGQTGAACKLCHDMDAAKASPNAGAVNHFRFLATPLMEGPARATIRSASLNFNTAVTPPTCSPGAVDGVPCHALRSWSQQVLP